jgi:hypothetical protein
MKEIKMNGLPITNDKHEWKILANVVKERL